MDRSEFGNLPSADILRGGALRRGASRCKEKESFGILKERARLAKIAREVAKSRPNELGDLNKQLEGIMTKRIESAAKASKRQITAAQLELARALMRPHLVVDESVGAIRDQIARGTRLPLPESVRNRLDQLMVQLASVEEDVGDLLERARLLAAYSDNDRMNMQIDSLMFEAAERLKGLRKERELDRLSGGALADLASFDGEQCERLRQDIISARAGLDDGLLQRLRGEAANFARKEAARSDGAAARSAILRGLQDLGYEIRMNGEVWTEGVCIAAQRPEEPNYDVELSAPTNGKIQSKVRVYDHAGRSAGINQRDVEMEQSWCDDLRRLHVKLASEGIVATIEDERKPGSTAQQPLPPRRGSPKRTTTSPARDQRTMD